MIDNEPDNEYEYYCTNPKCLRVIAHEDKVCPYCGADTSEFIEEEEEELTEGVDQPILDKKYPALRVIGVVYLVIAILIGILTLIGPLPILLNVLQTTPAFVVLGSILVVLVGVIGVVTFLALSEGIRLFIDIEHNTRTMIELFRTREGEEED